MTLRRVAILAILSIAAAAAWYAWHVTTVDLPLVTAPAGLVELPPPTIPSRPIAVWIDTDAACGTGKRRDVDDCWAIAAIARTPAVAIRGVTTVFGNTDAARSRGVVESTCRRFGCDVTPIAGAEEPGEHAAAAVDALSRALQAEKLFILSFGPATNIAAMVRLHPELKPQILGVVAVAGATETEHFDIGGSRLFHAHDQNFRRDVPAFETLLNAQVPLVLVPYDTTTAIQVTSADLRLFAQSDPAASWLSHESQDWLEHWSELAETDGFVPFDAVAAALLMWPERFAIERRPVQIRRAVSHAPEQFLVSSATFTRGWVVSHAVRVKPDAKRLLLRAIAGSRR